MTPRMEGFRLASADRVIGLDADDVLSPAYLADMLHCHRQADADFVCPDISFLYPDGSTRHYLPAEVFNTAGSFSGRELIISTLDGWKIGLSGTLMSRREILREYDSFLSENHRTDYPFADELLSRRLLAAAKKVVFCPSAVYFYRMNADSVTHVINQTYFTRLDLFKELLEWTEAEFGADSREYQLSQKMNFMALIECMRAMNSIKESSVRRIGRQLIRRNYSLIDLRRVKPLVPAGFFAVISLGSVLATFIFRLHHRLYLHE